MTLQRLPQHKLLAVRQHLQLADDAIRRIAGSNPHGISIAVLDAAHTARINLQIVAGWVSETIGPLAHRRSTDFNHTESVSGMRVVGPDDPTSGPVPFDALSAEAVPVETEGGDAS